MEIIPPRLRTLWLSSAKPELHRRRRIEKRCCTHFPPSRRNSNTPVNILWSGFFCFSAFGPCLGHKINKNTDRSRPRTTVQGGNVSCWLVDHRTSLLVVLLSSVRWSPVTVLVSVSKKVPFDATRVTVHRKKQRDLHCDKVGADNDQNHASGQFTTPCTVDESF